MRKFSKMSSDIVYQMDFFNNLFQPTGKKAEDAVNTAKAKKKAITEKCTADQTAVDKEISDAEAKVNQVAPVTAVNTNGAASLFSAPAKAIGGKSNKKKFSKKRKGGKRTKSQKKRR
jgi:hypothetical protein